MNRLRARLNELEARHPLAFLLALILACDAVLAVAIFATGAFA